MGQFRTHLCAKALIWRDTSTSLSPTTHSPANRDFQIFREYPELAGFLVARFCLCNGVPEPPKPFSASLSLPWKSHFPATETLVCRRLGSNTALQRRKAENLVLADSFTVWIG